MRKTILWVGFVSFFAIFISAVFGCSCGWQGSFLDLVKPDDLVVRVKVLAYHGKSRDKIPLGMSVEVLEVLYGRENKRNVKVWGDNGNLCRPYVTKFPLKTEWIMNIRKSHGSELNEKPGDYYISGCGEYWMKIGEGRVVGEDGLMYSKKEGTVEWLEKKVPATETSLQEFKEKMAVINEKAHLQK